MLAKLAEGLPGSGGFMYEPKWDGFRAIVFRGGDDVFIQSRDLRPLDRYFPELHEALRAELPNGCVVDGEIVIATPRGLDFDALQLRLHPAASRVAKTSSSVCRTNSNAALGRYGERAVSTTRCASASDATRLSSTTSPIRSGKMERSAA